MKYDDRYIVELSRAAIFDDTPFSPEEVVNWEYIYNKSIEQNITGLLFTAVSKLPEKHRPNKDLFVKWQQKMVETIAVTSRQYNEFLKMSKILSSNSIKVVILKGGFVRRLYSVPELRTMGDFDVLVDNNDLQKIKSVYLANDYEIEKDLYGIIAKNDKAYWEIFFSLQEEFNYETELNTKLLYKNSEKEGYIYIPNKVDFIAHLIVHTGKHYIEKGAGIRNLCDIALYIKKYEKEIDFEKVYKICVEQNYAKIYSYIISSLKEFFGLDVSGIKHENIESEKFMEYTLLNGVFGEHNDNSLYRQFTLDEKESSHGLFRLLFPSAKALENRYTYLKRFKFLLPVAWTQRIIYGRFTKKVKFSRMLSDVKGASDFSERRIKWLKELDLQEHH